MSLFDQKALLMSIHPFDLLSERMIEKLMTQMDITYYPTDTILIAPRVRAESLYIIIKGIVNESIDGELQNVYGERDSFDANALIYGNTQSTFSVAEDLICYELPKEAFLNLLQDVESFQNYFMQDFITKHQNLKERQHQNELTPFMVARVDELYLHAPCFVDASQSILSALRTMAEQNAKVILVREGEINGIVTDTNLREKVLLAGKSSDDAIGEIATYGLITIERSDFLFNALLLFTKYSVKRLVVVEGDKIVGILEQLDLLSHFANHTHLIAASIERATSIDELHSIQRSILQVVRSLTSKGVRVRYVSKLVSELNAKVYRKVYEMVLPKALQEKCALIVMGSEGRGEQVLRTDQDNALIIRDGEDESVFEPYMMQLNENLLRLGFPKCSGNVMVSNPYWRRSVTGYKKLISEWIATLNEETLMGLSIFLDAHCVAGDVTLLEECQSYLLESFEGRNDVMAHLAKATLAFETPLSMFSGFVLGRSGHESELDIKKGGIFAIVHGIRVLALEHKIGVTNTTERIKELNNSGIFDKRFASELIEAYDTLLSIRLRSMLSQKQGEEENYINPKLLNKADKDLLKDAFKIVNTFKKFLTYHFHLGMVV
ncbi:MAG: putative nucleotidyltransferase substrate binding domain-containing protein [Sulfuricurvum sp.]|uniref:putative nucleotidyltransferase substrate binding domain-containing protein n=1 Tax=Sulfuricurvum sp. TaxID=2025608 RepID=UPI0026072A23|nr:putative nucleotidyltransferase substrate binding domain-containing protein [Sulfuricurvum sp.]MDD2837834.1 putative nucleotidyltransferase substrate binding domain-containing protein [Sulfuricurvum sp.]MDD3596804.1 putative nucleotidyltransferase substrate binding domain-containing protein [Sulfuricurvum sp.]MDD4883004.1 putative nucleotidyltransferase substrate binding domain-containing protein [Sulfuricurvum sp.]